jgi:hypothetical protein
MAACTSCGNQVDPGDAFCISCGARQASLVESGALSGPPEPPGASAPPEWPGSPANSPGDGFKSASLIKGQSPADGLTDLLASDQLLGQAAPNTVYLGQRMMYEKEQQLEEFDPLRSSRFLWEVFRRWILMTFVWAIGCIPIFIVGAILGVANHSFGSVIGVLLFLGWCFVMACVFWLSKLPGQLSEWKFSVDDRGQAAPVVFDHIAWALQRRRTPMDSLQLRRFKVMSQGQRDVLEIKQGIFRGFVSCFENGGDLYVGWTFWLFLSPARYLWTAFRRLLWELRNKGHAIYVSLQFDRAKALREALHSAVREGVDVAAGQQAAQGHGTIGSVVPVVSDTTPWEAADEQLLTISPPARPL